MRDPVNASAQRERYGDWSQTFTDRVVYPLDPRAEEVCIEDVAHHLALFNRYCGATREPYSVADHSLHVEAYVAERFAARYRCATPEHLRQARLAALMHDATEAYLGDMIRPVKHDPSMYAYRAAEDRFARVVEQWLGLPIGATEWPIVKDGDDVVLATEKRDLRGPSPRPWKKAGAPPLPYRIIPRGRREAEDEFLAKFREFTEGHRPLTAPLPHYHHCPQCYERKPCTMDCTIVGDLSDDGVNCGYHETCADCALTAPRDPEAPTFDEDGADRG